jgi:hypothetical protein
MNIHTVADNLRNTIAGKEALLKDYQCLREPSAVRDYLEINIDELRRILADVEICCKKATEDSWALNPERMGQ